MLPDPFYPAPAFCPLPPLGYYDYYGWDRLVIIDVTSCQRRGNWYWYHGDWCWYGHDGYWYRHRATPTTQHHGQW